MNEICVKCGKEMTCVKNGQVVAMFRSKDKTPYKFVRGDKMKCSVCANEIVGGFGSEVYEHFKEFDGLWAAWKEDAIEVR